MKTLAAGMTAILALAGSKATFAETAPPKTLAVGRMPSVIPPSQKWGDVHMGFGCTPVWKPLLWGNAPIVLAESGLTRAVRAELKREGFAIANDPEDPFGRTIDSDLTLGGTVTLISGNFCIRPRGAQVDQKGEATIRIEWQVYSSAERRVVAKDEFTGTAKVDDFDVDGARNILASAVGDSLAHFTQSQAFASLGQGDSGRATEGPSGHDRLALAGALSARGMTISDAVGSVVLVLAAGGHGSGFLVSSDGYVITAQHVVGSDKRVKIRWSDGLEGGGEVVRIDRRRDVALVKVDPRGRAPLAMRRQTPQPGDTVFAIGAPLDTKNQNTVTRGVASANRIMDGFSFIQSDVTISPGNSGGPLLDEKGEVLGICDLTYRPAGPDVPTGINYFVPIDDALRFLSAEPQ